ncbi:trypsin-like serine protease (plasmid) [Pseudoalteromonas sp. T1lg65]|uniref:trypsin-like serine protease n=1 Tax=Pseudoalteromonas sp. T1lg65 TaxID=2077101 RepID=UPI003F7A6C01
MKLALITAAMLSSAATSALASSQLDIEQPELKPNIVGGVETPAYSRPYQVALLMNGRQGCGGTLISPNWVLTAAHCLDSASTSSLTVRVGAHSLSRGDGETLRVSQIISHEYWRGSNGIQSGYDIAVLRLASPASSQYAPAKLPTTAIANQYAGVGADVTVSGWGLTSNRGRPSDVLREVDLPVISNSSCSSQLRANIPNSVICGGGPNGTSACNGDSGGPFAVRVGSDFYSIGTVSWGIACSGATAFTRTTSYLDWIEQKTGVTPPNGGGTDNKPVADFTYSISGQSVQFTDKSTDDKGVDSRSWNFGDGSTSTQANPSHTYQTDGTYTVTLTVTDTKGQTDTTSSSVKIGQPPTCAPAWDASVNYALGDKVSFQGSVYEATWWSTGARPDQYSNVWKKVGDCNGSDDPAPVAAFSATVSGLSVALTNSSTDNGQIVKHQWNFGDGQTSASVSPSHTYAAAGTYTISLTVTDDKGQTNTASQSVRVGTTGGCAPSWSATEVYLQGDKVSQNGIVYQAQWWTQGDSPAESGPWGVWQAVSTCN